MSLGRGRFAWMDELNNQETVEIKLNYRRSSLLPAPLRYRANFGPCCLADQMPLSCSIAQFDHISERLFLSWKCLVQIWNWN